MATISRRTMLASGAAALAAAAGAPVSGTLVVMNWGGDWNDRCLRFVDTPFTDCTGVTIVHQLNQDGERKAELLAGRQSPNATVDVAYTDDSDAYALEAQEVLYELDPANIPNLADTVPVLRRGYFVPWLYSGLVLIHTAAVVDPPRAYADLWDSRWAGRLGLTSQLYFNYMMMAALVLSGSTANTQAAKVRLTELKTTVRPRVYPTHEMLAAALANGDVDVAVSYKARGLQWAHDGMAVRIAYPDEGAIAITFGASMPRRASNVGAAYAYMDAMLDPTAMAGLASASFYAPANTRTPLSPELSRLIDFSPEERARLHVPDYAYVAENTAGWREWWDKSFAT